METAPPSLRETLQAARKSQRISQLELALRMGVSQRQVSFVESGRARPSRELLLAWLQELQAPLALRNVALQQAGFAPVYRGSELSDAEITRQLAQQGLKVARRTVTKYRQMLRIEAVGRRKRHDVALAAA